MAETRAVTAPGPPQYGYEVRLVQLVPARVHTRGMVCHPFNLVGPRLH